MLVVLGACMFQPNARAQQVTGAVAAGEYIVKFAADVPDAQQERAIMKRGGQVIKRIKGLNMAIARFQQPKGADATRVAETIKALESDALITYAEPNRVVAMVQEPDGSEQPAILKDAAAVPAGGRRWLPAVQGPPIFLPDDPQIARQYAWNTIGGYRGWASGIGAPQVVIAIVDTGVDPSHPDLAGKLVPGYDFVDNDRIAEDGAGHGTHVAGTAAAITNNGIGVAGTCPGCSIMPVRVLGNDGLGYESSVIAGIIFAADNGAHVINLSLSGSASKAQEDAINYAWAKGVVLTCAAGNDGSASSRDAYPAASPNCMAVAATDSTDAKAQFSNYGTWVDIAAPGVNIYSTWLKGGYNTISGTSMATPHVAGAAGLLAAKGLNNIQIRAHLEATADKIAGTGVFWAAGRLNIQSAMR